MKTILMFSPNDLDGVSLYRHWGPMLELERKGHVRLVSMSSDSKQITNWQYYKKADMAFIHRPTKNHDFYFIKECQKHGLPVWVDIDDNFFRITDDNDAFQYYSSKEAHEFMVFSIKAADRVTVATRRFQTFLRENFQIEAGLIPNALDDAFLRHKKNFGSNNKVLWRGSRSHLSDLLYFEAPIIDIIRKKEYEFDWIFLGMNPFFISRKMKAPPISWHASMNYIDYMIKMTELNASFNFVPLLDCEFSRTRSVNGWMESTLAGGVTLAPNWDEWTEYPGMTYYETMDRANFYDQMDNLLSMRKSLLKDMHESAWNYIIDNLLLSKVNQQRLDLIMEIAR